MGRKKRKDVPWYLRNIRPGYSSVNQLWAVGLSCNHINNTEVVKVEIIGDESHKHLHCGLCGKNWIEIGTAETEAEWHTVREPEQNQGEEG